MTRKVEETDIVMAEVEAVSQQYLSLSSACSSIYFTMESLNQVFIHLTCFVAQLLRCLSNIYLQTHFHANLTFSPILFQMHFLYQYSLHFFLDTFHTVLYENPNLKGISDHSQRLAVVTKDLFQV